MTRVLRGAVVPLALLAAIVLAFRAPLPYFTEQPGQLFGLSQRIQVEGFDESLDGEVLFGTVNVRLATLAAAVRAAADPHVLLVRRERFLPEGLDAESFSQQQRGEFALASQVAAAVGLRAAGLRVDDDPLRGEGAVVLRVLRGGPARGRMRPGDVITAVNGRPVATAAGYREAVESLAWDPLTFTVRRDGSVAEVHVAPAATRSGQPGAGLVVSTHDPEVVLPVGVRVGNARVGGPSAGLAIALAVFDLVAPEDLLAGRRVVVTGTIDTAGRVGTVGGVRHKAVAAERAGVGLLLVPAGQAADARAAVGDDARLEIIGVASFTQALEALRAPVHSPA